MPDLRDDTTDDGFHEIQFSSKQLVFLFMAASVILIFVFLAGVLVGRDTTSKGAEAPIAEGPAAGEDPASQPPDEPTPTGEPTSTAAAEPGAPPPELTYPTVLNGAKQPPAATKPPAERPSPTPVAVEPPAPTPQPTRATAADAGPTVPTSGKPGQWVIQVVALKTRSAAAERVQSLRAKGYEAFLEDTAKGLYRVRVGKFRDRDEALRVARRIDKEEGTKSVVQR